jgi:ATP-dependent Clp protease adaptor protein ClpS
VAIDTSELGTTLDFEGLFCEGYELKSKKQDLIVASQSQGDGGVATKEIVKVKKPSMYRCILLNDDFTPMDFVILVLKTYFNKDQAEATEIMLAVHNQGRGNCGTYSYEVAESKSSQVNDAARREGHPLQCIVERI